MNQASSRCLAKLVGITAIVILLVACATSGEVKHKQVPKQPLSTIGAFMQNIEGRLVVQECVPNGPAYRAGLKKGDVIVLIDNKNIPATQITAYIDGKHTGSVVKIAYLRNGKTKTASVITADPFSLFKKAAQLGNPSIEDILASFYYYGWETPKDYSQYFFWISKAAEQGYAEAEYELAFAYIKGTGTVPDSAAGTKWFLSCAELGTPTCEVDLGGAYLHGIGVRADLAASYLWMSVGAHEADRLKDRTAETYAQAHLQSNDYNQLALVQKDQIENQIQSWETYLDSSKDLEQPGIEAEKAGHYQEALAHDIHALQSLPDPPPEKIDMRLRKRVIRLAGMLHLPRAPSQDALKYEVYGKTAAQEAMDPNSLQTAISEFQRAVNICPWWPDGYYNLAVAFEKANDYGAAARNLEYYLLAEPDAPDAKVVQMRIYTLQFKASH